jgi:3-deoxy-7-phosphoheptulonate synthase
MDHLNKVKQTLSKQSPIVFAGETSRLQHCLAEAGVGKKFVLIGGDCAETFSDFSVDKIKNDFHLLLEMSLILMYGAGKPVVQIGRLAGQFAKPRSDDLETRGDLVLPSYRGDIVNRFEFEDEQRSPDPENILRAYHQSTQTLNLIRAFIQGGYSNLYNMNFWCKSSHPQYDDFKKQVRDALYFLRAAGIGPEDPNMKLQNFYTGHECLLLDYEEPLTRRDTISNKFFDCSAHFLWIGERTRMPDSAQVEFIRGVANPIGIKLSSNTDTTELVQLLDVLNPNRRAGRITLIIRMGAKNIDTYLPDIIEKVRSSEHPVTWISDPMHGNTYSLNGTKTRNVDAIKSELTSFFRIHDTMGTVPGGIHLEMTHKDVTECVDPTVQNLGDNYDSKCDPRLNKEQSLEMAFYVSKMLQQQRN